MPVPVVRWEFSQVTGVRKCEEVGIEARKLINSTRRAVKLRMVQDAPDSSPIGEMIRHPLSLPPCSNSIVRHCSSAIPVFLMATWV